MSFKISSFFDYSTKLPITTFVTIGLAFLGYLFTYIYNLKLTKRKDNLERINKQLGDFYGPLFSLLKSNEIAWVSFMKQYKPAGGVLFDPNDPPTEDQLRAWTLYMKVIFAPAHEKIHDIIVSKSDLLIEDSMPECLLDLISHIVVYKAVVKKWEEGDFSQYVSIINFPIDAQKYIYKSFKELKRKQYKML